MPHSEPNSQMPRMAGLDAARLLATFGIVWVHVAEGQSHSPSWSTLGRFGTSFYVIVAGLLVVQGSLKPDVRSFTEELQKRASRLLKPYVVWSLIYGAYYGYRAYTNDVSWVGLSRWWGPVAGTAIHLWFLPFVFVWGLLATRVVPPLSRLERFRALVGGAAAGLLKFPLLPLLFGEP